MRIPRKLKKAIKKWCSVCCEPFCFRYRNRFYYVALLSNGRLLVDIPRYEAPSLSLHGVSLEEFSFASQLEDKLNKLINFGTDE